MCGNHIPVQVDATDIVERSADDRGRVNLGTDYADKQVRVAVVDVVDAQSDN